MRTDNNKILEVNIIYCLWDDEYSSYMRSSNLVLRAAHHTDKTSPNTLD